MNELHTQKNIEQALKNFQRGALIINAKNLLNALGYESELTIDFESNLAEEFIEYFDEFGKLNTERAMVDEWESIDFLFQLTEEEISGTGQTRIAFKNRQFDDTIMESYVFFAVKLKESHYTRTQLSMITREINKPMPMPAMILFQHGQDLSLAVIDRRLGKRDPSKDVLEKVTLIKDIDAHDPHPAHIKILFDLSRNELFRVHGFSNFVELHRAWAKTLDIQELNKQFYRELSNWYFWAMDNVTFPEDAGSNVEVRNATSVIHLITRLVFVWFLKEKKLVPDTFFNPREVEKILVSTDPQESTYYKAILQNLFFATLNQEMNTSEKPNNRKFRGKGRQHYNITSLYRYEDYFTDANESLQQFETIPFLNGGLFECLDKKDKDDSETLLRVDGFSDRKDNQLSVPNFLFFSDERVVDLNKVYDTRGKRYKVRGLIEILRRYKFTITENTPIEEEVALDPELLGKVFENLLAAYNPETGATARKQTGSFYTPREIVNYMVDESLIAYLKTALITYYESESTFTVTSPPSQLDIKGQSDPVQTQLDPQATTLTDKQHSDIEKKLRRLLAYNDKPHEFTDAETDQLINAIDTLKILDPACGSGAFPMGILHKLVFILAKLDPGNNQWRQRQIAKVQNLINIAEEIEDSTVRRNTLRDLEREIDNINEAFERNELDYGRKLYLIENCIYGVDIQPIAVQIAKLRFFISLVVDQRIDDAQENRGVRPLPNLETKFVAGDALISVDKPEQQTLRNPQIDIKEKELSEIRRKHFTARTPRTKDKYRKLDKQIREEIGKLLKRDGFPSETTEKIASWDPYDQNATADWFDSEWMFGLTVGFDIVIGNPPYISITNLPVTMRNYLLKNYRACKMRTDIYIAFLENSISLLNTNGIMGFILPFAFAKQKYGEKMRQILIENHAIREIVDASGYRIFENATVYNIVLTVGKHKVQDPTKVRLHHSNADFAERRGEEFLIDQHAFAKLKDSRFETKPHVFDNLKIKEKIWQHAVRFDQICLIAYGARLNDRHGGKKKRDYISHTPISGGKRFCEGRNIERYSLSQTGWLDYSPDEHYNPMFPELFENKKLIFINVVKERLRFAYDDGGFYNCNTVVNCVRLDLLSRASHITARRAVKDYDSALAKKYDYKFLLGVLNSDFTNWYFRNFLSEGLHFYPNDAKELPIPNVTPEQQVPIITLVDQILDTKCTNPDSDTSNLENEIDILVYELYTLTEKKIHIVEGKSE